MLSFLNKDRPLHYIFSPYQSVHNSDLEQDGETAESNLSLSSNTTDSVVAESSIDPSKSTIKYPFKSGS
jgi:hypothetical protein